MPRSAIIVSSAPRAAEPGDEPHTYRDKALSGRIALDSRSFERCSFRHAVLVYSGGPPPSLVDCTFADVGFEFQGPAGRTLALMQAMSSARSGFRDIVKASFPSMFGH